MGRKHLLQQQDPILQKNHRIQKRRKAKLEQRARQQQQREKQRQKLEELSRIKQLVLDEEKSMVRQALRTDKKGFMEEVGVRLQVRGRQAVSIKAVLPQLEIGEAEVDGRRQYEMHFFEGLQEEILGRVQKQVVVDSANQVKNDLREMFGKEPLQQPNKIEIEQEEYDYELKKELRQTRNVSIKGSEYLASKLFENRMGTMSFSGTMLNSAMTSYRDYIHIENKEQATIGSFRSLYVNHILNHLKICGEQEKSRGFTNAKILILAPFMGDARSVIDLIAERVGLPEVNRQRIDQLDDQLDLFRISITISQRNKRLKYFANFDHAHIILASPLGLRTIIGSQGQQNRDFSFLSSVEILIIERSHVILMQNWLHLLEVVSCLNKMPKYESMVNPIQSIREGFLNSRAKFYRQNIVFSEFAFPELNALAKRHFQNRDGVLCETHYYGGLQFPGAEFQQEFVKVELPSLDKDLEVRLDFFRRKLWNNILADELLEHYVIFAASYFEFLRLKSFLQKVNAPAVCVSEHTPKAKVQSRLSRFNNKQFRFLLTTERAYYFEVCKVQKIEHILFYSLPRNSWVYRQLVESLRHPKTHVVGPCQLNSVVSLCSRYDIHALERVIGTVQAQQLLAANNKAPTLIL